MGIFSSPTLPDKNPNSGSNAINNTNSNNNRSTFLYGRDDISYPIILINHYLIPKEFVINLSIRLTTFLPTLYLKFSQKDGFFNQLFLPKKGDKISIYLTYITEGTNSKGKQLDFICNEVAVLNTTPGSSDIEITELYGQLYIPDLYKQICKCYEGTSLEILQTLAKELNLGFKTNITETDDNMKWICPWNTYYHFIHDITKAAWIDEDSFFEIYVDMDYNLNFIELESVLQSKPSSEIEGNFIFDPPKILDFYQTLRPESFSVPIYISNLPNIVGTNYFIESFEIDNNYIYPNIINGEKRDIVYYDGNIVKRKDVPNISSIQMKDLFFKGDNKDDDFYDSLFERVHRHNFTGIQYALPEHNTHKNKHQAEVNNMQKLEDLNIITHKAQLGSINMNLYRSQNLMTYLFITNTTHQYKLPDNRTTINKDSLSILTFDEINSGTYYIKGMTYNWFADLNQEENFKQTVFLFRKTKPIDPRPLDKYDGGLY